MKSRFDCAFALIGYLKERGGDFATARAVAKTCGLPAAYLEKVAQDMKHAGWIEARKGPGGGYRINGAGRAVSFASLVSFYSPFREFCPVLRARKK